ncbi:MAG: hypothetical protein WC960_01840, partial [Bacteroidales bacterium]
DVVINNSVTLEGALPAMEMVWGKYYKLKVIYSQDGEWYRAPLAVNKVERLTPFTNCHLVNPPQTTDKRYRFRIPIDRVNQFAATSFGVAGNVPTIEAGTKWVANIIWKDVDISGDTDLITLTKSTGIGPNDMIEFEVQYDADERFGNALIGIKLADESFEPTISSHHEGYLWSWHIWISDYDGKLYDISTGVRTQLIMDRNLGARSNTINHPSSMGLLYQFGRKDPFIYGSYTYWEGVGAISLQPTTLPGGWIARRADANPNGTVEYTVSHPTAFIKTNTNPNYQKTHWMLESDVSLWSSNVKTIYDPCPDGFKLPDNSVVSGQSSAFGQLTSENFIPFPSENTRGRLYGPDLWFPYNGFALSSSGAVQEIREAFHITSVSRTSGGGSGYGESLRARTLYVKDGEPFTTVAGSMNRGTGAAARCIEWEGTVD